MVGWPSVLLTAELGDLADDVRKLFQELGRTGPSRAPAAGECQPPLDVLETDGAVQILMDLPGVAPGALKVLLKGDVVLIAGEKWADAPGVGAGGHHLVERGSGRFARAIRVAGAFDGSKVTASLDNGELCITLPKLAERRGRGREVPVTQVARPSGTSPSGSAPSK
jgi:HSP20 family protein